MKRIIISLLALISVSLVSAQQQIAYVETTGSWHYVYDAKGKKLATLSRGSVGEVVGWGSSFFITKSSSFYKIRDAKGKILKTLSEAQVGKVIGVAGETFTSRLGSFIYTWDKNGKKLSTRAASNR